MADKFENQVQDKMAGLTLQPSEAVWKKVESRIEKKKKRRWLFLLIFPSLFAGGYWYWQPSPLVGKGEVQLNREIKTKSPETVKTNHKVEVKNSNIEAIISTSTPVALTSQGAGTAIANDHAKKSKTQVVQPFHTLASNTQTSHPSTEGVRIETVVPQQKTTTASKEKEIPALLDDTTKQSITLKEIKKDTSIIFSHNSLVEPRRDIRDSSSLAPTINPAKKKTWHTGFLFTAGISDLGNNYPGLVNYPGYLTTGYSGGGIPAPSKLKAGFGFKIGIKEEKSITSKTKIVTGINLTLFSTFLRVGTDSGLLSTQNPSARYSNHYSFIELPLSLKFQLSSKSKTPFYAQAGLVISEMIGSNALQVGTNGIYHQDNSLFNKTQLGFNSSLSFSIFPKQKNSISLGPYIYYGATGIAKTGMYAQKHFVFVGLQTQVEFGKH